MFVWPIFPAAGFGSLRQAILPSLCLGAPFAAEIARLVRTGMLDVLGQDYIRTAYAKGLPTRTVILRHAMKGAVLPLVSYLGPTIVDILTGSTIIEQIFAIPGLGYHFVQSALRSRLHAGDGRGAVLHRAAVRDQSGRRYRCTPCSTRE